MKEYHVALKISISNVSVNRKGTQDRFAHAEDLPACINPISYNTAAILGRFRQPNCLRLRKKNNL